MELYSNYQGKRIQWDDHPQVIREAFETYLMDEMACKIRENNSFFLVNRTNKSPNTVNRFLSALKSFYKSLIQLKQYKYSNPLVNSQSILEEYTNQTTGARKGKLRMPTVAGTEDPIPHRRLTDSYFKLVNEEWRPEIIDDPHLPYRIYQAGKKVNWSLREVVIARMLFETGARASEVIKLTIGDYRTRKSFQEVNTFNKGSHGRRVKFLRFSKDTVKLLFRYINNERIILDSFNRNFEALPDNEPIFLTDSGTPHNYNAWYYHWNKAMNKCEIKLNPHKSRHWFVTTRVNEIYNTSKTKAEIEQRKSELIKYVRWSNSSTIEIYEHHFDEQKHRESHDRMLEHMKKNEKEYVEQNKRKRKGKSFLPSLETTKEFKIDDKIQEFLDGLE
ncbi:tyrosine-type recombinase/integrase [Chengkuizengella axinellae]